MLTARDFQDYCFSKKGAKEDFPFDETTVVYRVCGKIFALTTTDFEWINLKCNPALAEELREKYPSITAGYHMNKRHWNTVQMDGSLPDEMIYKMIDDSYELIVSSLTKAQKAELSGS